MLQALYPGARGPERYQQQSAGCLRDLPHACLHALADQIQFRLSLSLVLLLGLFAAAWAAVFTARRLVQPISDIAEGTRRGRVTMDKATAAARAGRGRARFPGQSRSTR